jgi:hypothetical protein
MTQNVTVYNPFSTINRTESYEQDTVVSTRILNLVLFKNFALLYIKVGAGAAGAGAAKNFNHLHEARLI